MSPPIVSVIIPTYNRCDLIRRSVGSLLDQAFEHDFELVVVDDGSTDGTGDVISDLDSRVRVIRQSNRGAAAARCRGVREARGNIVAFLDSDDVSLSGHLSNLWNGLHRRSDIVASHGLVAGVQDRSQFVCNSGLLQLDDELILHDPLVDLLRAGCFTASMNLMTYRDLALHAMKGREKLLAANDYDFTLRLATLGPFAFVDEYTIRSERRSDGISHTNGALQAGFAVLAARDAVRLSSRRDKPLLDALCHRVELVWPSAAVQLMAERRMIMALKVIATGLRCGRLFPGVRRLWWSLQHLRRTRLAKQPCS